MSMNFVLGPHCSCELSNIRVLGTPASLHSIPNATPAPDFLSIGTPMIAFVLVKTWKQELPRSDFTVEKAVSVYHTSLSLLNRCDIKSVLYRLVIGCAACRIPLCVVALIVFVADSIPMFHLRISATGSVAVFFSIVPVALISLLTLTAETNFLTSVASE